MEKINHGNFLLNTTYAMDGKVLPSNSNGTTLRPRILPTPLERCQRFACYIILTKNSISRARPIQIRWLDAQDEKTANYLLTVVDTMMQQNKTEFQEMISKLSVNQFNCEQVFIGVADEVLDGDRKGITWSRIAILFAFAATLAKHCLPSAKEPTFLDKFGNKVGQIIDIKAGKWIEANGGWSKLEPDLPSKPRNDYLLSALGVGTAVLGALLTVVGLGHSSFAYKTFLRS